MRSFLCFAVAVLGSSCFDAYPPVATPAPITCFGSDECPANLICFARFARCVAVDTACMNADGSTAADGDVCADGICLDGLCVAPACGDGVVTVATGEQCDDQNDRDSDRCLPTCQQARCGDGIVWAGVESCDDGPAGSGLCTPLCGPATCGDGRVNPGEACDDELSTETPETANDNICLASCQFNRCGDGFVHAGVEACDDGNDNDNDGCRNTCGLPNCGDGELGQGEECDDGDTFLSDDCLPSCLISFCGDGVRFIGELGPTLRPGDEEQCDDGNDLDTDTCIGCRLAFCGDGFLQVTTEACDDTSLNCNQATCALASCGDGIRDEGEQCDDGNNELNDECLPSCRKNTCHDGIQNILGSFGIEACDDGNLLDVDDCILECVPARCGDGFLNLFSEGCDDGNTQSGDSCTENCGALTCGDGRVDDNEACDDGNLRGDDSCLASCREARCGDGVVRSIGDASEQCDDANIITNDGCSNSCVAAACGDGILQPQQEDCDTLLDPLSCPQGCILPVCGNGIPELPEECDDGNDVLFDNCYDCIKNVCGDGITNTVGEPTGPPGDAQPARQPPPDGSGVAGLEECDDGDDDDNDACLSTCFISRCGDGFVYPATEVCDVLNDRNCSSDCLSSFSLTEGDCTNAFDDDGDGDTDCFDDDCVFGLECSAENCSNGVDDNANLQVDCADPDCFSIAPCIETLCSDNVDNEGDGPVDCADVDCAAAAECLVEGGANCNDGIDNDSDDRLDCMDESCAGTAACPSCDPLGTPFGGGSGSLGDPFLLCASSHVAELAPGTTTQASAFLLADDIDVSLQPLLADDNRFDGTIEGNDHVIGGLTVTGDGGSVAWFRIFSGVIRNLTLEACNIQGEGEAASLANVMDGGSIANIRVNGAVIGGAGVVGGLVSKQIDGIIRDVRLVGSTVASTDTGDFPVGGIVGLTTSDAVVERVLVDGKVEKRAGSNVGGVIGIHAGRLSTAVSSAGVTATAVAGGVVGVLDNSATIEDVLANGFVSAIDLPGGLAGQGSANFTLRQAVVTARISGSNGDPVVARRPVDVGVQNVFFDPIATGLLASGVDGAVSQDRDFLQSPMNPVLDVLRGWFRVFGFDPNPLESPAE